jgi:hypothetical protein
LRAVREGGGGMEEEVAEGARREDEGRTDEGRRVKDEERTEKEGDAMEEEAGRSDPLEAGKEDSESIEETLAEEDE